MTIHKLLIANRGEIAIRIAAACADLGIDSVAVFAEDDSQCLHTRKADEAVALRGRSAKAYLDGEQLVELARQQGCEAIHPGYGFLSENADFAQRCAEAGILFVGPDAEALTLFGDKARARKLAERCDVPVTPGTQDVTSLAEVEAFWDALTEKTGDTGVAVMIKALAGGGGRGMRPVRTRDQLAPAYERCRTEAQAAFGCGDLYVEQLVSQARHIEIQVIGDGRGNVSHLGERECSLQRRHQKLVEIAPSPSLKPPLRQRLAAAALRLAGECNYRGLGTFEFLVSGDNFYFIEANPRVQVEHTVTEAVTGIDLVAAQIRVADGAALDDLGLRQEQVPAPRGYAIQLRINMESYAQDGELIPQAGVLATFELPGGPGVRVDSYGYAGYQTSSQYDSLLAKLILHSPSPHYPTAVRKALRALRECHIEGVATNIPLLQQMLHDEAVQSNDVDTGYLDRELSRLLDSARQANSSPLFFETAPTECDTQARHLSNRDAEAPPGCEAARVNMTGVVVEVLVNEGDEVAAGQPLVIVEAMKMEHLINATCAGVVRRVDAAAGDGVHREQALVYLESREGAGDVSDCGEAIDLEHIRPDLQRLQQRLAKLEDAARPQAVAKRHARGQRTARENITDLIDESSLLEYGGLAVAAQRSRRSLEDLEANTPADGLITGIANVNGDLFANDADAASKTRVAVLSYDYTVLAGTQGYYNHHKTDRIFQIARDQQLPVVFFCEGGGGRPGDTDFPDVVGLQAASFAMLAKLSGLVPLVGIVSGRCFAGNAALLGCHDVIIGTRNSSVGMAGPAMIEGGGLGSFHPDEIGPAEMQAANGVIDILVEDEVEAVAAAKQYLSYFQGALREWGCEDQRYLRHLIPQNRLRSYDVRRVIEVLADTGSVLELRKHFGCGIVTALIRIEGRTFGLVANDCRHLGGAIDADSADKMARFIQLCNAFDLPMVSLIDTPGFMVGPEAEKQAQVRRFARIFVAAANMDTPYFAVALRKGYGLGAQAMAAGHFHAPLFTVSWPTGEFGAMGLEGAVRLGYRRELEAQSSPEAEKALFDKLVAEHYERGQATRTASVLDLDNVIDPAETRRHLIQGLDSAKRAANRDGKKVPFVDTW